MILDRTKSLLLSSTSYHDEVKFEFESTFDIFKSDALGCHQPAVLINCERLFNKFPTLGTCWNSHKIKMKTPKKTNVNCLFITTTPSEM